MFARGFCIVVCTILLAAPSGIARATLLSPHAYIGQATDNPGNCSTTTPDSLTPNYGGYFDSVNANDVFGGSTTYGVTKEMWLVMYDSCNKWIETGYVDGRMAGGYWQGSYWALNRSTDPNNADYYEERISPEYITGSHTYEIQWDGTEWQIVVDGTAVRNITSEGSVKAKIIEVGIEGQDSSVGFNNGTYSQYLEYLQPDNTYTWNYWAANASLDNGQIPTWHSSYSCCLPSGANEVMFND